MKTNEILSEFSPFSLNLKGLSYFPTSVYVRVEDPLDQLRMINKRLTDELGDLVERSQYDGDSYIPHVTIGTFNTKAADDLVSRVTSEDMKKIDFGNVEVYELEVVEARMYLLLGPAETQDQGLGYVRSFQLT